mgnify:CR=1 FL=1
MISSAINSVEIDKAIAGKYEGLLTDEKVQQMMIEFKPKQDLHGMNAAYLYQNALQSALFRNFSDLNGNWNGFGVSDVFESEEIKIGYIYGWLQTKAEKPKRTDKRNNAISAACVRRFENIFRNSNCISFFIPLYLL